MNKKTIGNQGENKVVQFLITHGFKILKRNFFWSKHEIDIIASKNQIIYLIEVKTISDERFLKISMKQRIAYETFILRYLADRIVKCYVAIVRYHDIQFIYM